ncbi:hypothetical protein [Paraburkholderia jirisanensis]
MATLRHRARRQLAVIFQRFNLVQRISALDNIPAGRLAHIGAWRGVVHRFAQSPENSSRQ